MRLIPSLFATIILCLAAATVAPSPVSAQAIPGLGAVTGQGSSGAQGSGGTQVTVDPVELLLDVLQDEQARTRLIEQLQSATAESGDEAAAAEEEEAPPSLAQRVAQFSEMVVSTVTGSVGRAWSTLSRAPAAFSAITGEEMAVIFDALRTLLLTIVVTVALFLSLRAVAIPFYRRIGERAAERPVSRRFLPFIGAGLMDFAIVLVSWSIGYGIATLFFSEGDQIELRQVLYLNAFLLVEMTKTVFRLFLSPSTRALRPLRLTDWAAKRIYRVMRFVISVLGYGAFLIVPIVMRTAGYFEARSTNAMIWLIVIGYLAATAWHYRRTVGNWLLTQGSGTAAAPDPAEETETPLEETETPAEEPETPAEGDASVASSATRRGGVAWTIAHSWHWFVYFWLFWLMLRVVNQQPGATGQVLLATGKVALAVIAGLIVSGLLGHLGARGMSLPHSVTERVPLLESRINRYVPRILLALRFIVLVVVLFYAFSTLDLVSTQGWIGGGIGLQVSTRVLSLFLIVLIAFGVWLALTSWVDYRLNPVYGQPTAREQTLLTLLRNAGTIAVLAFALMFGLSEIGVNIGPLLASAGVVGLAIGFGAQKMVQDIITGIFIQFENAINVGDVVSTGGITGVVEKLTVRSVSLRDLDGVFHIIPFSSVDLVSNYMRDFSFWLADIGVAYRENVDDVKQAMFDAFEELRVHPEQGGFIVDELEWFGLNSFGDSAIVLRARIKTWPGKQWGVGRAYNEIIKRIFDERGIEIPFPHTTVWFGEDREGKAPPMRIAGRMETRTETVRRRREEIPGRSEEPETRVAAPTQDAPPDEG